MGKKGTSARKGAVKKPHTKGKNSRANIAANFAAQSQIDCSMRYAASEIKDIKVLVSIIDNHIIENNISDVTTLVSHEVGKKHIEANLQSARDLLAIEDIESVYKKEGSMQAKIKKVEQFSKDVSFAFKNLVRVVSETKTMYNKAVKAKIVKPKRNNNQNRNRRPVKKAA